VARPLRLIVADGVYHATARGIARDSIFADDRDRRAFLRVLERTISRFDWRCLSYCLMPNHFHLLLRTPRPTLSRGMAQLKSGYAQAYNRRHERIGPLFAGRYGARLVQRDAHLLEVFRYIALNPVTAGLCASPSSWPWSAHAALARERSAPRWLAANEARAFFDDSVFPEAAEGYRAFVSESSEADRSPDGVVFGDDEFRRRHLPDVRPGSEFAERDWGDGRPDLDHLLRDGGSGESIALAYCKHGYTMASIAAALGCHVCTVSRRLRAYESRHARMQDLTPLGILDAAQ
jgi:putative transposase